MYGISSVPFAHNQFFERRDAAKGLPLWTLRAERTLDVPVPESAAGLRAFGATLLAEAGIDGTSFGTYRQSPTQIDVYAYSFWKSTQLKYFIDQKKLTVEDRRFRWDHFLTGMHARGGFEQDGILQRSWSVVVDLVSRRDDRVGRVRPLHVVGASRASVVGAGWRLSAALSPSLSSRWLVTRAFPDGVPALALGCMRLSTERERDDDRAVAVLHAAFDAGVTLLDTADAYCLDAERRRPQRAAHRPRARDLGRRPSRIRVATKGGLTRPDGRWVPDGRADTWSPRARPAAARSASSASTSTSFTPPTRARRSPPACARSRAQARRRIESIGLCNVNVGQIEEARRIAEIAAVQVELSVWKDDNILSGVAASCIANGIRLLAYRPLGGRAAAAPDGVRPLLADLAASMAPRRSRSRSPG